MLTNGLHHTTTTTRTNKGSFFFLMIVHQQNQEFPIVSHSHITQNYSLLQCHSIHVTLASAVQHCPALPITVPHCLTLLSLSRSVSCSLPLVPHYAILTIAFQHCPTLAITYHHCPTLITSSTLPNNKIIHC